MVSATIRWNFLKKNNPMTQEARQEQAIAVKEVTRMEGWDILMAKIQEEIGYLQHEQESIELEGRSINEIGVDYIKVTSTIKGLRKLEAIANDIIAQG